MPHSGLLKGELIKKITVKDKDLHRDIIMNMHSNTTVWEFKKRIGEQMRMIPKYLKLNKGTGSNAVQITSVDNGKTLEDLGVKNRDIFTAMRDDSVDTDIEKAPLVTVDGKFTE